MSITSDNPVYWDPYDVQIAANPYPVFRRLREEAPLYHNEKHNFYALSRFDDVEKGLRDHATYISGRGVILEAIKANLAVPPGVFIFEDPPAHTVHRSLLNRVFTARKMNALEPRIRAFCARCLDPLVGRGKFDFVKDVGAQVPMRVIGMLLGIPEPDLQAVRERGDAKLRTEAGQPIQYSDREIVDVRFEEYIDWRVKHPSDDLMTELLNAEFVDETGTTRRLTRQEVLIFVTVLATAGNETTNRLIGWIGKVLAEHPDQRCQIAQNRALIPQAIEEVLRYEPPADHIGRCLARDVALHGTTVPQGSAMLLLTGAANRDDRRFPDGDRFDIHREQHPHLTFGYGIHACIGSALARVEGRAVLDEVLNRFPQWDVDWQNARMSTSSIVRGWETLPVFTR
jgi:cytochrome P450